MKLMVKHAELNQVSNNMKNDSEDLDKEIDKMLESIEKLRDIWQGADSVQFCDHAEAFVTKMKNVPITMRNMMKVIDVANKGYEENDEAFGRALKVEAQNYEETGAALGQGSMTYMTEARK